MSIDDKLWLDKEDQVGQLVGDTVERGESQPILMKPVLKSAEKVERVELGATYALMSSQNQEEIDGAVVYSANNLEPPSMDVGLAIKDDVTLDRTENRLVTTRQPLKTCTTKRDQRR